MPVSINNNANITINKDANIKVLSSNTSPICVIINNRGNVVIRNGARAVIANPIQSIVQNGLVLHLDSAILDSYPGTGNNWYDLTTEDANGILTNGPVFNSENGGFIRFDGANDVIIGNTSPTSLLNVGTSGAVTIEIFFRIISIPISANRLLFQYGGNTVFNVGYGVGVENNGTAIYANIYSANTTVGMTQQALSINQWLQLCVVFSGSNKNVYINTNFIAPHNQPITAKSADNYTVAALNTLGTNPFNCDVGIIRVYNRILTAGEILQNFNASRWRFGI